MRRIREHDREWSFPRITVGDDHKDANIHYRSHRTSEAQSLRHFEWDHKDELVPCSSQDRPKRDIQSKCCAVNTCMMDNEPSEEGTGGRLHASNNCLPTAAAVSMMSESLWMNF